MLVRCITCGFSAVWSEQLGKCRGLLHPKWPSVPVQCNPCPFRPGCYGRIARFFIKHAVRTRVPLKKISFYYSRKYLIARETKVGCVSFLFCRSYSIRVKTKAGVCSNRYPIGIMLFSLVWPSYFFVYVTRVLMACSIETQPQGRAFRCDQSETCQSLRTNVRSVSSTNRAIVR